MEPGTDDSFVDAIVEHDFDKLDLLMAKYPGFCKEVRPEGRGLVLMSILNGSIETLQYFVEKGCDVNDSDSKGLTALQAAAELQDPELVGYLLSKGAEVDKPNILGNSPLFRAVSSYRGDDAVVKLLVEKGANPKLQNKEGKSPLSLAVESQLTGLVAILERAKP